MSEAAEIDVAVFGGGIAGLWLLARLRSLGFDALLFEKTALGSGQTIASQGIIHSGLKYTFDGLTRPQTEVLSSMPAIWMDCIAGHGEVDLRGAEILTDNQLMFTTGGLFNRLAAAVASKTLSSNVETVTREHFPEVFRAQEFSGKIYRLAEPVLASRSVVSALHERLSEFVYRAEVTELRREGERISEIRFGQVAVRPRLAVFTAGSGNEWFAHELGLDKRKTTQRRPLRMLLARGVSHSLYAHCLVPEPKPRVTVTTHDLNGEKIWYLGGNIAEKAVGMSDSQTLRWAHDEMKDLFPWLDWSRIRWAIHDVDRAEPAANKLLPSGPALTTVGNAALAWPTKLSLAPALASKALSWIEQQGGTPSHKSSRLPLSSAAPARYPWEEKQEWLLI